MIINIKKWINNKFYKEITCGKSTIKLMSFTKKERAEEYGKDFLKELKKELFENEIEKLADVQHEIWSHWMKYLFSKCRPQKLTSINHITKQEEQFETGNYLIPKELVGRWIDQMHRDYSELSEKEKESDREQVRKFFDVFSN